MPINEAGHGARQVTGIRAVSLHVVEEMLYDTDGNHVAYHRGKSGGEGGQSDSDILSVMREL